MNPEIFDRCSTILLDIAGTVGSINFIENTLFAFAKKNVGEFLTSKWEEEETKKLVAQLKADGDEDVAGVTKAVERFSALTDEKSINAGVKTLQGLLYKQGYETGQLKAHVFDDIKACLEGWSKQRKICVFSSGSEEAQKQYFTHSTAGDLSAFIDKYFDQSIGKKTEVGSYETIASTLEVKPQEMLFISDDVEEIKAASTAGCTTVLVTREGNAEVSAADKKDRMVVSTFEELPLSAKRKMDREASSEDPPAKIPKVDTAEEKSEAREPAMEVDSTNVEKPADEAKVKDSTLEKMDAAGASDGEKAGDKSDKPTEEGEVASSTTSTDSTEPPKTALAAESTIAMEAEASVDKSAETRKEVDTAEAENKVETTTPTDGEIATKMAAAIASEASEVVSAASSAEPQKEETSLKGESKSEDGSKPIEEQNGKVNGQEATNGDAGEGDVEPEGKENKSEIANGMADSTPDDVSAIAEEVAVKKLEDANETTAVPVEA